ncbi:DUF2231 domain-containing protein [Nitrospina watsonii]|uniref:DUF2231 domain-containing protein n=1 Tax=Nitrospina watsonii TaxID=1323948 RepID=A0ABN8W3I2_9BACT|nr:DUF2231 domain-containing protein [Nitrospina watsonii]CAI2719588.1 conserved membrane protein of unknown function [Nitrospina watsonii]
MNFAFIHPLIVHFPIALLTSGSLLELYGRLQKEPVAQAAGRFNVQFGFWAMLLAAAVGLLGLLDIEVKQTFRSFLGFHILYAFTTITVYTLAMICYRFRHKTWADRLYLLLLCVGMGTTLATGYFGGELVHRFGLPAGQPLTE